MNILSTRLRKAACGSYRHVTYSDDFVSLNLSTAPNNFANSAPRYVCLHTKLLNLFDELRMCLCTDCFDFWDLSLLMYVLQCGDALCSILDARLRNYAAFNCPNTGITRGNSKIDLVANQ